jgi:hypothetical protein
MLWFKVLRFFMALKAVIFTPTVVAKANDAWVLIVAGVLAAGITLPAAGQSWREWAFATAVIVLNVVMNAIRRAWTLG